MRKVTANGILASRMIQPDVEGYHSFSEVSFNPEMDEAVVRMGYRDCNDCGGWDVFYLRQTNGKWAVEGRSEFVSYHC